MKHVCVSVRDSAVGAYNRPFFAPSIGAAIRSFSDEVNRAAADNVMHQHPDDFELWVLSEWEEDNGKFVPCEVRVLSRGKDVKVSAEAR